MIHLFKVLLSPLAFAAGFLWPLSAQTLMALDMTTSTTTAYGLGLAIALAFGLLAHFRGSWLWIK